MSIFTKTTDFAFTGGALPNNLAFKGSAQQQVEDAEVRGAQLELQLETALGQNRLLSAELVKAKDLARSAFRQLRTSGAPSLQQEKNMADNSSTFDKLQELEQKVEDLQKKDAEASKVIEQYEGDLIRKAGAIKERSSELSKAQEELKKARQHLEDTKKAHEGDLERLNGDYEKLAKANEKLQRDVDDHKANATHNESILARAYADQENIRAAYNALTRTKDDAEAQTLDLQMRYDSLYEQWQEDRSKIDDLESRVELAVTLQESVENLKADLAYRDEQIRQYPHMLLVKDERIASLELQYQKERERNMHAADAAAKATLAAATSHNNEAPPALGDLGTSLADELSDWNEDDFNDHESDTHEVPENELSPVSVIETAPIAPPGQRLSIDQTESVSVVPVAVPSQRLSLGAFKTTSTSPIDVPAQHLSIGASEEYFSVSPVSVPIQRLSIGANEATSTSPIEVPTQHLSTSASEEYFSVSPVDVPTQRLSIGAFETTGTSPIEVPIQRLSTGASEYFSMSPIDIVAPPHTLAAVDEINNISPIEVVEASAPTLTLSINEAVSVTPIERAITFASTSMQTDLQDLTAEIVDAASVITTPVAPAIVASTTTSTQTETPRLTSSIVDTASVTVQPTVPASNHDLAPITTLHESAPIQARLVMRATSGISSITVTHDCIPVEVCSPSPTTTTAGVQTFEGSAPEDQTDLVEDQARIIEDKDRTIKDLRRIIDEPHITEEQPHVISQLHRNTQNVKPNTTSFSQVIYFIAALVSFLAVWQWMKVKAWETANGYTSSSGSSYNTGGAYGNGRHLLGIPLAQDIGAYWWTEQIANIASRAIAGYEKWAGIEYVATY
ncbi:hypothetical protein HBI70_204500 [Parastagonospora nodorum]|nr:hypothetical protein HBH43_200330 [Parastagonospora nodorum]KAH4959246.1 hypothetical protein HBI78_170040 [Parastagonospora nodorum]KAH5032793.1 hypothetical protein HBI75_110840 [Parastagonospora nodorum]KAH5251852.1 hypothetical protein HBI70_204500 [Parastagonospora nodorum]KAH5615801.1 hypothetical protein HBI45_026640 [Parastagonospora nodorum]